ncbi:MAG: hypothetical protein RB289_07070 [Paludibacter sp.]|jgi:hypothetical protein|nr:hypothetical protein [Paludibacter sp.]
MRKTLLIAIAFFTLHTTYAQYPLNVFKPNLSVENIATPNIDSITFDPQTSEMRIFRKSGGETNISISGVDSINFNPLYLQLLPVPEAPQMESVLNTTALANLRISSPGGTSVTETGICWSINEQPTINDNKMSAASLLAVEKLSLSGLTASTTYYARAYAINSAGTAYSEQISFSTNNFKAPSVETVSATFNYATNKATCVVKVTDNGGCVLTQRGICWSTKRNPTTADNVFASGISVGQFYAQTGTLDLNKIYYIRSFATNCMGTTYGNEMSVQALMGNVTYTLAQDVINAGERTHNLIKTAMDSACYYYNRYTTFRANIWVYYNAGIPTAQASYHGSIGFGPNERYMFVGTAMHEMAHYFGSGTTTTWKNMMVGGLWQGAVAKALCLQLTGQTLKGDNNSNPQHYWPTGINQREEVKSQTDLINHTKIVKAMLIDDAKLPTSW